MTGYETSTPAHTAPDPQAFRNLSWELSHGVRVKTHNYDDTLCAFEVTQHHQCLGTMIPNNIGDMERLKYVLDNNLSIDGFECNDDFGTVIRVKQKTQKNRRD
mgnify:CR=1 FL=1